MQVSVNAVIGLSIMDLHRRLGHLPLKAIRDLVSKGLVSGIKLIDKDEPEECEACIKARMTRKPIKTERQGERAKAFGEEIHSDIWGPARVESLGGRKYYVSFTDDATRWTTAYLQRAKSDTFKSYQLFAAWVKTQMGITIACLHADRGGEYLDKNFISFLDENGTNWKFTVHDTPEDNGVSERLNRTLMEKVRALIISSGLPLFMWGEALLHAVWLKNRTSTKALGGQTP